MDKKENPTDRARSARTGAGAHKIKRKGPARVAVMPVAAVTQSELRDYYELQSAAWEAEKIAHDAAADIERRIKAGATVEDGPLTFDRDRRMVRTRKMG